MDSALTDINAALGRGLAAARRTELYALVCPELRNTQRRLAPSRAIQWDTALRSTFSAQIHHAVFLRLHRQHHDADTLYSLSYI